MSHSHSHPHDHGHRPSPVVTGKPSFSLLRLSALERLAGSAVLLAGLWLLVFWVLR